MGFTDKLKLRKFNSTKENEALSIIITKKIFNFSFFSEKWKSLRGLDFPVLPKGTLAELKVGLEQLGAMLAIKTVFHFRRRLHFLPLAGHSLLQLLVFFVLLFGGEEHVFLRAHVLPEVQVDLPEVFFGDFALLVGLRLADYYFLPQNQVARGEAILEGTPLDFVVSAEDSLGLLQQRRTHFVQGSLLGKTLFEVLVEGTFGGETGALVVGLGLLP